MVVLSFTGAAYALAIPAFILLAWRVWRYWQAEQSMAALMFFAFSLSFLATVIVVAFVTLVDPFNAGSLRGAVIAATFFQGLGASFWGYLVVFLYKPRLAYLGFFGIFLLTILSTALAFHLEYAPVFVPSELAVEWDIPLVLAVPRTLIFVLTFVPLFIIMARRAVLAETKAEKERAAGLAAVTFLGIVIPAVDFLLEKVLLLGIASSDIALLGVDIILIATILATSRRSQEKHIGRNQDIR